MTPMSPLPCSALSYNSTLFFAAHADQGARTPIHVRWLVRR